MFLFPRIPKPDVPPKRHVFRFHTIHSRFLSRFLPARQLFSLGGPAPAPGNPRARRRAKAKKPPRALSPVRRNTRAGGLPFAPLAFFAVTFPFLRFYRSRADG